MKRKIFTKMNSLKTNSIRLLMIAFMGALSFQASAQLACGADPTAAAEAAAEAAIMPIACAGANIMAVSLGIPVVVGAAPAEVTYTYSGVTVNVMCPGPPPAMATVAVTTDIVITVPAADCPPAGVAPAAPPAAISCADAAAGPAAPPGPAPTSNGEPGACELTVTYAAGAGVANFDACGGSVDFTFVATGPAGCGPYADIVISVPVNPAPLPTIVKPAGLPVAPISCAAAAAFTAADATYSNSQTGDCLVMGTITADVTPDFNACGGTIEVVYEETLCAGTDAEQIITASCIINVNPAAAPVLGTLPLDEAGVACDGPIAAPATIPYTNSETGDCAVAGDLAISDDDGHPGPCGGNRDITWEAMVGPDDCQTLLSHTITITYLEAPVAVVMDPVLPTEFTCDMAIGFSTPATYTNSGTAPCLVEGELTPTVVPSYNLCDGGSLTITYSGVDECDRPLSAGPFVIPVLPDEVDPEVTAPDDLEISCEMFSESNSTAIADWLDNYTATDNCDADVAVTHSFDVTVVDFCAPANITVTWTAVDDCGNDATDDAMIIIIEDEIDPVIANVPDPLVLTCADISETTDPSALVAAFLDAPTATDNCELISLTYTGAELLDVCGDGTPITITWTAEDKCGNTAEAMSTITVTPDAEDPVVVAPGDLTITCAMMATSESTISGWLNQATATDDCSTPVITHDYVGTIIDLCTAGTTTVTFTATDLCGKIHTETADIIVEGDLEDPVVVAPGDLTITCAMMATSESTISGWLNQATATDDCSTPVITHDYVGTIIDLCTAGTTTVTFTATDLCGKIHTETADIIVEGDLEDPVVVAPGDLTITCAMMATSESTISGWLNQATATDDCSTPVITHDYVGTIIDLCTAGTTTVTFTATDLCGKIHTETADIIVEGDLEDPVVVAPGDLTITCAMMATSESTISGWLNQATATDDCSTPVITHDYVGTIIDLCTAGTTTVTFTATDLCGKIHTETADIIVEGDLEDPVVVAPGDLTITCAMMATSESTISGWLNQATATDDCSTPVITHDYVGTIIDLCTAGTTTVTFTATDLCGKIHTETADIIVEGDLEDPVVVAPGDLTITCAMMATSESTISGWLNQATATDDCSTPVITHDYVGTIIDLCTAGTTTVTFTATDLCGKIHTETADIIVEGDLEDPVVVAPGDLTITCAMMATSESTISGWLNQATATDDCSTPVITHDYVGTIIDLCTAGTTTVTFTATDLCGKIHTETADIIVEGDLEDPVVVAPGDLTITCAMMATSESTISGWLNQATATDDCSTPVITHDYVGTIIDLCTAGTTTVTFTATDLCGKIHTETADIIVEGDLEDPVVVAPGDLTITCAMMATSESTISGWLNQATATDDCSTPVITHDYVGTIIDLCTAGTTTVTFTATDLCGKIHTETADIIVEGDLEDPVVVAPGDLTITCAMMATSESTISGWLNQATATDDCSTPVITHDYVGTIIDLCTAGTTTVTFTATDLCGKIHTETADIIVEGDLEDPVVVAPGDLTITCAMMATSESTISGWLNQATATDDCSTPVITHDYVGTIIDLCTAGTTTVTFTATDLCGKIHTETADIIVEGDLEDPVVVAPGDLTITCAMMATSESTISGWLNQATATDDCSTPVITHDYVGTIIDLCTAGTTTVTFTATDLCGKIHTETADIIVEGDLEDPVVVAPGDLTITCAMMATSESTISGWLNQATATDDCSTPVITHDYVGTIIDLCTAGTTTVTFTATDLCGKIHTETADIIVEGDLEDPVVVAPGDLTITCAMMATSESTISGWLNQATATDDCSTPVITHDYVGTIIDLCTAGTTTVTFTATDLCGKIHTETADIIVEGDLEDPVVVAPGDLTITCAMMATSESTISGWLNQATATDDCSTPVITHDYVGTIIDLCTAGTTTVTFTATDLCGKTHTETADIIVEGDLAPPVIVVPATQTYNADVNCEAVLPDYTSGTATTVTDACDTDPVVTQSPAQGTVLTLGTTVVTLVATDACGNNSSEMFDVVVVDITPPVALCKDIQLTLDANGAATITAADVDNGSYDNCDTAPTLAIDVMSFGCTDIGTNTVVLTVTDDAGNMSTCMSEVTIINNVGDYELALDVPEICLDGAPSQLDFTNYLTITDGEGNEIDPNALPGTYVGVWSITSFSGSGTGGSINPVTGVYTPGTGTGFDIIRFTLSQPLAECNITVEDVFELYEPVAIMAATCACDAGQREVEITGIGGGLSPYTLNVTGGTLASAYDGTATTATLNLDPGNLSWSATLIDSRGCETSLNGACNQFVEAPTLTNVQNAVCATDPVFNISAVATNPSDNNAWAFDAATDSYIITDTDNVGDDFQIAAIFVDNGDGTLTVDPSSIIDFPETSGTYTITFTYGDVTSTADDCATHTVVEQITIYPSFDACFALPIPVLNGGICESAAPFLIETDDDLDFGLFFGGSLFGLSMDEYSVWTLTDGQGDIWSTGPDLSIFGQPVSGTGPFTLDVNTGDVTFDPDFLEPGTYTINHSIGVDACQTECSATITIKPTVDATIEATTVCGSPSGTVDLTAMFDTNTTGGGSFTIVSAVDVDGDDVTATGTTQVIMLSDNTLQYDENGDLDYTITVEYAVGDPACAVTADDTDATDCFMTAQAVLTITGGHSAFLDLPADNFCSMDMVCGTGTTVPLWKYMSIEDVTWDGLTLGTGPGEINFEIVAVDGSYATLPFPGSFIVDANANGVFDAGIDFDYRTIIDLSCGTLSSTCPVIDLTNVPKEVTLTVRMTYNDPVLTPGTGACTAIAEDNIWVKPTGCATLQSPTMALCSDVGTINLVDQTFVANTTVACGKFKVNCLGMPTADPGYTDANANGYFDNLDPNYPNYDLDAFVTATGTIPTKLYITYMVGDATCGTDMKEATIEICPAVAPGVNFGQLDITCTEGNPIDLFTAVDLQDDGLVNGSQSVPVGGTWYWDSVTPNCGNMFHSGAAATPGLLPLGEGNSNLPACLTVAEALTNGFIDPVTLLNIPNPPNNRFFYILDSECSASPNPCLSAIYRVRIDIASITGVETCQYFGDGETYDGETNFELASKYCSDAADLTAQTLRLVCPEVIDVPDLSDDGCDVNTQVVTAMHDLDGTAGTDIYVNQSLEVTVAAANTVYPNATINDDWFVQLLYYNQTDGDPGNVVVPNNSTTDCQGDAIDDPDDLDGGDHAGFIFSGTGLPFVDTGVPSTTGDYIVYNNVCPTDDEAASTGVNPMLFQGNSMPGGGSYNPFTTPVELAGGAIDCSISTSPGTNDYFILQFSAEDIYAMYDDGDATNGDAKKDFINAFFGSNCDNGATPGSPAKFTWDFGAMTLQENTDIYMTLSGMEIYNYKEDVYDYNVTDCPGTPAPDLGFTIDMVCDGTPQTGAAAMLPTWVSDNLDAIFEVETIAGTNPGLNDCYKVSANLDNLIQPSCDDACYTFEICHTINKCIGDCSGDGEFVYCRKVSIDKKPNLVAATPIEDVFKLGCAAEKPVAAIADIVAAFGFTTDVCNTTCTTCPASCSAGCFANGTFAIASTPMAFDDYVINDGTNITVLPSIFEGLGVTTKSLTIPFEYTVKSSCETCAPETVTRNLTVTKAPEFDLALNNSPGICPEDITIIPVDADCQWPDCVFGITLTNATTQIILGNDATTLNAQGICDADNLPVDPNQITGVTLVNGELMIDWNALTLTEPLFGNFTLTVSVFCGTQEYSCTASDSQELFFLGEVNAEIVDITLCEDDEFFNLSAMFTATTTAGGTFTIDCDGAGGNPPIPLAGTSLYGIGSFPVAATTVGAGGTVVDDGVASQVFDEIHALWANWSGSQFYGADDDAFGNGFNTDFTFTTPSFDVIGTDAELSFDYRYRDAFNSDFFDVTANYTDLLGNPQVLNLLNLGSGNTTQIGSSHSLPEGTNYTITFTYDDGDGWSWFVGIDNILISDGTGFGIYSEDFEASAVGDSAPTPVVPVLEFAIQNTQFDLSPGTCTITYTVGGPSSACNETATAELTITPNSAFRPTSMTVCADETLAMNPVNAGGTWTVSPASGGAVDATGVFTPSASADGLYEICYTFETADNPCGPTCTKVYVVETADATIVNATICEEDSDYNLTGMFVGGQTTPGGTFCIDFNDGNGPININGNELGSAGTVITPDLSSITGAVICDPVNGGLEYTIPFGWLSSMGSDPFLFYDDDAAGFGAPGCNSETSPLSTASNVYQVGPIDVSTETDVTISFDYENAASFGNVFEVYVTWNGGVDSELIVSNSSTFGLATYSDVLSDVAPAALGSTDLTIDFRWSDSNGFAWGFGIDDIIATGDVSGELFNEDFQNVEVLPFDITAGTYTVTYKVSAEGSDCIETSSATLTILDPITATITPTPTTCPNPSIAANNGSIALTNVMGGGGTMLTDYTFFWSTGETTDEITGLTAGGYTVTITSADGCETVLAAEVLEAVDAVIPTVTPPTAALELDCADLNSTTSPAALIDAWLATASVMDNCDSNPTFTHNFDMGLLDICAAADYSLTVTWTATDATGNSNTGAQTINVTVDDEAPTFVTAVGPPTVTTILDFEAPGTSASFRLFGNGVGSASMAANPHNGGNTALEIVYTQAGSDCWTGTASDNDGTVPLAVPLDFTTATQVCFDYYEPNPTGSMLFKFEDTSSSDEWEITINTTTGWNNYCINATDLATSGPATGTALTGNVFDVVVVFPEFWCLPPGTASGQDGTYYFDNVATTAPTNPPTVDLTLDCADINSTTDPTALITQWLENNYEVSDDCELVDVTYDYTPTALDVCTASTTLVTWTATDACGNSSAISANLIITPDTEAPMFATSPMDLSLDCDDISSTNDPTAQVISWLESATATDDCELVNLTYDFSPDNLDVCSASSTLVTWTAIDFCGLTSTHTANLIITPDTEAPTANPVNPVDETVACGNLIPAVPMIVWSDNCSLTDVVVDFSEVITTDDNANEQVLTRTWTATDLCGNVTVVDQVITIDDTVAPVLTAGTAPANATVECGDMIPAVTAATTPIFTDNCGDELTVEFSEVVSSQDGGNCFTLTRTWTPTDLAGNIGTPVVQVITVDDTMAPVASIANPADATVACGNLIPAVPTITWTDNCNDDVVVDFSEVITTDDNANEQVLTRTWTATDLCGNVTVVDQVITIDDTVAPVMTGTAPANATVECGDMIPAVVAPTFTDNCGDELTVEFSEVVSDQDGANCFTLTRTWTATDLAGNIGTPVVQVITVNDTMVPTASAPGDMTVECGNAIPAVPTVTFTDNCGDVVNVDFSETQVDSEFDNEYQLIRTWVGTDACGNATTITQTITVEDTTAPTITCPSNQMVDANVNCDFTLVDYTSSATVSDNCDITSVTQSPAPGTLITTGTTTVTLTVTDDAGNSTQCMFDVIASDNTDPVALCLDIEIALDATGAATITPADIDNGSYDNCTDASMLTLTASQLTFGCADLGNNVVTLTVEDAAGNTATCNANVNVTGDVVVDVQNATLEECPNVAEQDVATFDLTAAMVDVAGGNTITYYMSQLGAENADTDDVIANPAAFDSQTKTVFARVENGTGCYNLVAIWLTVNDSPDPDPNPWFEFCENDLPLAVDGNPVGGSGTYTTHTWGGDDVAILDPATTASATPLVLAGIVPGVYKLTYQVTDDAGCISEVTHFKVLVHPSPVITACTDTPTVCDGDNIGLSSTTVGGTPDYTFAWSEPVTEFASTESELTISPSAAGYPTVPGTYTYTVVITDENGCTDDATVDVVFNDNPVAMTAAEVTNAVFCASSKAQGNAPVKPTQFGSSVLTADPTNACANVLLGGGPVCDASVPFASVNWYESATGGEALFDFDSNGDGINDEDADGDGQTFDPIAAGLVDANTPGTYTFYAEPACAQTAQCTAARTPVTLTVLDCGAIDDGCTYLLVLEDSGANGWDGASIDVSINSGAATNYKVTTADCDMLIVPISANDGGTIDLTYWNGANENEHSWTLYSPLGMVALDESNVPASYGPTPPANQTVRVKLDCPQNCDETGEYRVVIGMGSTPMDMSWELYNGAGDVLVTRGAGDYMGQVPGSVLIDTTLNLNSCDDLELIAYDGTGNGWSGGTWSIQGTDADRGTAVLDANGKPTGYYEIAAGSGAFGFENVTNFTIPCKPTDCPADETVFVSNGNCEATGFIPAAVPTPFVCYPNCGHAIPGPVVTVSYPSVGLSQIATGTAVDLPAGINPVIFTITYTDGSIVRCNSVVNVITNANPTMTCNDNIIIALPAPFNGVEDCDVVVTPDDVLEAVLDCEGQYVVTVFDANGASLGNTVGAAQAGQTLQYEIQHLGNDNLCWGTLTVEDKYAPIVECQDFVIACNHPAAMDENYNHTETYDAAATDLPVNIAGNAGSDASVSVSVGCGPLGEIIQGIAVTVNHTHSRSADLLMTITAPNGLSITTELPTNQELMNLFLGEQFTAYAGTWTFDFVDTNGAANSDGDVGKGKITGVQLELTAGFPRLRSVVDCTYNGDLVLLNEMLVETDCDQSEWLGAKIIRTWQAIDAFGNSATCTQEIGLRAPTTADLGTPSSVSIECGTEQLDANGSIDLAQSGGPAFDCFDIESEHHGLCDVSLTYEDVTLPSCGNGYKVIRTWTILNWCSGVTTQHEQTIKVEDTTGPSININNIVVGTSGNDCTTGSLQLSPAMSDNCSGIESVTATYTQGGGAYNASGTLVIVDITTGQAIDDLPFGITQIAINAKDNCGNETNEMIDVNVQDSTAPVAICDDELHVSLGSDGTAQVSAADVDEGSYDNCTEVTLEVRRTDGCLGTTDWADTVPFECCDIDQLVTVELRVTDAGGNSNVCWKQVLVEDALAPVITCAPDKTLACDSPEVHDPFGEPTVLDNCDNVTLISVDGGGLDQCQAGILTRTWTASDGSSKSADTQCTQRVTVEHESDFIIQFPADVTLTNCAIQDAGEPTVTDDDCELIAINSDDVILSIVEDACYKIERTWTVINWCVYDEGNAANTDLGSPQPLPRTYQDDDGYFQYTQVIKVLDSGAPTITCPGDQVFDDLTDGCEGQADLTIEAEDACSPSSALEYSYKIDAFNDDSFDIVATGNDASGVYPYGTHLIKWVVEDGCGNTSECSYLFTIRDAKNPTPVCLNGISAPGMNSDGCVEVWANDLLEYAFDNCSSDAYVEASVRIREAGDTGAPQSSVTLCCADGLDTRLVEVWVEDEAGNADYCTTYIILQDPNGICDNNDGNEDDSRMIAGNIATQANEMVEDVMVEIESTNGMVNEMPTANNGHYMFDDLTMHMDYTLTPEKDSDPLNGVSTFDIVLMSQHILGFTEFTNPYQLIAADVNNDGNITTFDVVQTRQLILYTIQDFPTNTSWRFVDADYVFPVATNPWFEAFPEMIEVDNLTQNEMLTDFVAIKIGDINGDAIPNTLVGAEERNTTGTLNISIDDAAVTKGNTTSIDFRASDFDGINGYQFTLNFDANAMNFAGVEAGALTVTEGNFGLTLLEEGVITTSWNSSAATKVANDEILFSLNFEITADVILSDALSANSRYTTMEAYAGTDLMDVNLVFNTINGEVVSGSTFELYQNTPNPFNGETVIGFTLPTAGSASLTVMDVTGKVLNVVEGDFAKGYNQISLNSNDLKASGVLYYQLDTPDHTASKKMIILE